MFVCLSVCLSVQGLAAKLLEGSPPNLAWTSPWTLRMLSKNFFGGYPPRGGIILEKLKNSKKLPYCLKQKVINSNLNLNALKLN